jgi:hypothetical protein
MSSFYSDASLIVIPSGYKASKVYCAKPTDGSGDLVFSRSNDTATRVNSAGLIEKVRTNLNLYSEQMDNAYYTKTTGTTVTANNAANPIDGALTADTINYDGTGTSGSYRIYSSPVATSLSGYEYTWSVWLRCATPTTFILSNNRASTSVNVTSTWQRFSVTGIGNGSSAIQTLIYSNSGNNSPFVLEVFGQQVELGVMTDYIATTTAAVSVGPVANVPRLDYLGSSCPRLLLEPQRTNLATYSEQFNNAAWTTQEINVTANAAIAPDGTQSADNIVPTAITGTHQIFSGALVSSSQCAMSVYAKANGYTTFQMLDRASGSNGGVFNLANGTATNAGSGIATITSVGNGWYRCTAVATTTGVRFYVPTSASNFTGDGTSGVLLWGAQLEAGAYATSYIPTLGAASVTRGADACSKTGISSLIGQTEGTLFADFVWTKVGKTYQSILLGGSSGFGNTVYILTTESSGAASYQLRIGGTTAIATLNTTFTTGTRYKIALAYKSGSIAFYVNGISVGTSSATYGAVSEAISQFRYDWPYGGDEQWCSPVNQTLLFKTRLSNSELAQLTTI